MVSQASEEGNSGLQSTQYATRKLLEGFGTEAIQHVLRARLEGNGTEGLGPAGCASIVLGSDPRTSNAGACLQTLGLGPGRGFGTSGIEEQRADISLCSSATEGGTSSLTPFISSHRSWARSSIR